MTADRNLPWVRLLLLICGLLLLVSVYQIVHSIQLLHSTGVLDVSTNEPNAAITISQPDHTAALLGKGEIKTRLKPGDYQVAAKLNGNQSSLTVHITTGKTTVSNINPAHTDILPATTDASILNFDALGDHGLTEDQVAYTQTMFNTFAPNATSIVIDSGSILSAPHDPNSGDPFVLNFNVTVDAVPYRAALQYSGDENVTLTLYDSTGKQIYLDAQPADLGQ